MQVYVLTSLEFSGLLVDAPGMTLKLLRGMARRLRDLDQQLTQ
jgi:CRP-like cAMP-binding protein